MPVQRVDRSQDVLERSEAEGSSYSDETQSRPAEHDLLPMAELKYILILYNCTTVQKATCDREARRKGGGDWIGTEFPLLEMILDREVWK